MTAIAGIQSPYAQAKVGEMLNRMSHRGNEWQHTIEVHGAVLGAAGTKAQKKSAQGIKYEQSVLEYISRNHYAGAKVNKNGVELSRDPLGISPLYYGRTPEGDLCFASEVKGLLVATKDVHELPPGHSLIGTKLKRIYNPVRKTRRNSSAESIARELRRRLEKAVLGQIAGGYAGSWLSGGIDSTALAAIARPYQKELHTFTAGLLGSQDAPRPFQPVQHCKTFVLRCLQSG